MCQLFLFGKYQIVVYNKENMFGKEANMAEYVLENNILKVTVDSKGCEIRDVLCKTDNTHRKWSS